MILRHFLPALPLNLLHLVLTMQPSAVPPIPAPLRELPWAQLNFLHTTDTHGWHAGHLQEPSYSADWGDYISFSSRLKERADREGVDLLIVDTGDRIEGNGLYDASRPKGKYDMSIFDEQEEDLLCSGNHELYKAISIKYEYNTTVPNYRQNYLASNLDVIDPGDGEQKPLAQRFKKFTTKNQGIRILAMGFLFDFKDGAVNIVVQKVKDAINAEWFQDAIRDRDVDLFLIIGHVPLHSPEFDAIYTAIRKQQWDKPIQFFGGHTHIRDYAQYDKKACALESGRYLETIGFMSINGLSAGGKKSMSFFPSKLASIVSSAVRTMMWARTPTFARRYIDNNLYSFYHHTGLNASTFPTPHGLNVSKTIHAARQNLHLDHTYGCVPQSYWTNRAPFPSDSSIFSLLQQRVLPDKLAQDDRKDIPRIVLTNTGAIRFDMMEGKFTVDTMYAVSPFTTGFRFVKDVPWRVAKLLLQVLNQEVPRFWPTGVAPEMRTIAPVGDNMLLSSSDQEEISPQGPRHAANIGAQQSFMSVAENKDGQELTPGYTTHDAAGSDGDDTIHSPIKFYEVPNCIESRISFPKYGQQQPETVDVVYNEFIQQYILLALKFLGTDVEKRNTMTYMDGNTMTALLGEWVSEHWKCDD